MSLIGKIITLKGKSGKGKNRVRELGDEWEIVEISDGVLFSDVPGPWYKVSPSSRSDDDKDRWIHSKNDEHFIVKESK